MRIHTTVLTGLLLGLWSTTSSPAQESTLVTVRPHDNGQALVNSDMGWTMHFYSNIIANYGSKLEPSDTLDDFPGLSHRLPAAPMVVPRAGGRTLRLVGRRHPGSTLDCQRQASRLPRKLLGKLDALRHTQVGRRSGR